MKKIILAKNAGFCFGVKRAVESALDSIEKYDKIFTYGEIIHNKDVVKMLEEKGAKTIDSLDGITDANVVIRSHGVAKSVYDYCAENNINVIDNTCPFVAKVHEIVKSAPGLVIIIGESTHPEIIGLKGWVDGECIIVNSQDEAALIPQRDEATVVVQTTFDRTKYEEIIPVIKKRIKTPIVFNTICSATEVRQKEAVEVSKQADCVVIVGGKHSSNSKKLFDICKANCKKAIFIENADELPLEIIETSDIIGVVAGASTPDWIIREVITAMSENMENEFNTEQMSVADAVMSSLKGEEETPAADVQTDDKQVVEDDVDFIRAIDQGSKPPKVGDIVTGTVMQINKEEIIVDIAGFGYDGMIPKNEYSSDANVDIVDSVKIGDKIDAQVLKLNNGEGYVLLSVKKIAAKKLWNDLEEKFKGEDAIYSVTCKEAVNGGVIAELDGVNVFIPASLLDIRFVKDLTQFVGQTFDVKIVEFDKYKKKIIGNRRVLLEEEVKKQKEELWNKFSQKQEVEGTVKRLTDFGAFIDIGGIDGLLHIADIAWYRINHPSDVLKVNDKINVLILSINKEKERISLGLKQLQPKPWETVDSKYKVGDVIKGKVVRVLDFGAFVELEPGVDGLIHISQISLEHVDKVADKLNIGDEVECKVISVDSENKKISLSIKQLLKDRAPKEEKPEVVDEEPGEEEYVPEITESSVSMAEFFPENILDELKDE